MTVLIVGHRGARACAPENTLAGLRRGVADGADGLEFDVRLLGDGTPVLLHDATVDRTTNGRGPLAGYDRASVTGLDAGSSFGPEFAGEPIPFLDDVLRALVGRTSLAIEMKEVLTDAVLDAIGNAAAARGRATVLLASFQAHAVARARARVPGLPRALILPEGAAIPDARTVDELALWGIFAPERDVTAHYMGEVRGRGLAIWVYTVNDPARAAALADLEVGGIITDDPARILARLRSV